MFILIPVDGTDAVESKITTLLNVKHWALINFDGGVVNAIQFFDERTQIEVDWIDYAILDNKYENYIELMGEGMTCLVRREEETIEELFSAFRFKELDEIG
jgi:hypothetical protein